MARDVEHRPPQRPGEPPVRIVRSTRRRARASAFARDGHVVVQLPAHLPTDVAERTITDLVARVTRRDRARRRGDDAWLQQRACAAGDRWLDGIRPTTVSWSNRMTRRWASATPATGAIRISTVAAAFPDRVLDYLLVHELAHLVEPNHGPAFHDLVAGYPDADWARGFLAGVAHAAGAGPGGTAPVVEPDPPAESPEGAALREGDRDQASGPS